MHALSASELLAIWESAQASRPIHRGLALLAAARSGETIDAVGALSVGSHDMQLLQLRQIIFGSLLECQLACPACQNQLELGVETTDLLSIAPEVATDEPDAIEHAGWRLRFRLPRIADLTEIENEPDPRARRRGLLSRCVLGSAPSSGAEAAGMPDEGLPPEVEAALCAAIERRDTAAALGFEMTCPACAHVWSAPFDILSFFWGEIDAWARRTLREVHLLASAYGWRETDILTLSAWRRQAYLQMAGHG